MSNYRILDELGVHDSLVTLEPSRRCACHCTWCGPMLNRKARAAKGERVVDAVPETFARHVNRAFGPEYDPTDFLQWGLRNKLPIVWSSGVEPWQDVEQATATLDVADRLDLPFFVQTRGTHWREVWPRVLARRRQFVLYVSIPSDDPAYAKRFEPGTPPISERFALLEAAADAGIATVLSIAPYHPEWCPDVAGFVERAIDSCNVSTVFLDPLHISANQRGVVADRELIPLACPERIWTPEAVAGMLDARAACVERGVAWYTPSWRGPVHRLEGYHPDRPPMYADAREIRYHDESIFEHVHPLIDADDAPPILVTWEDALAAMELDGGAIDQPFAWRSIGANVRACGTLPPAWKARLKDPRGATLPEYLRALWNNPTTVRREDPSGFVWRHPFVRLPVAPDGAPWVTESGDLIAMFDPSYEPKAFRRTIEDPSAYEFLTPATGVEA